MSRTQGVVTESPETGAHDTSVWQAKKKLWTELAKKKKKEQINTYRKLAKSTYIYIINWSSLKVIKLN